MNFRQYLSPFSSFNKINILYLPDYLIYFSNITSILNIILLLIVLFLH